MKQYYGIFLILIIFILSLLSSFIKREGLQNNIKNDEIHNTFKLIIDKINDEIIISNNNETKVNSLKDALDYTNYIKNKFF